MRQRSVADTKAANEGVAVGAPDRARSAYFFKTFFITKLSEHGYTYGNVQKWTKRGAGKRGAMAFALTLHPVDPDSEAATVISAVLDTCPLSEHYIRF